MKKITAAFMAILLVLLLVSGCGTASDANAKSKLDLADGTYTVDFQTDSSMFHVNEAYDGKGTLTVTDGQGMLHITLVSKKIVNLYVGTAADAEQNEADWLQPTTDTVTYADGMQEEVYGFDVPVSEIGEEFDLAILGKKGVWYDHKVSVQNPVSEEATNGAEQASPTDALADGSYTCEVTLQGGSGRATVDSPAQLSVENGVITATIVWSSPHYEYMIVDGVQYDPVQTEGNSTFEIPVVLDQDLAVQASTVAMSEPHLIDYTLHFDGATCKGVHA